LKKLSQKKQILEIVFNHIRRNIMRSFAGRNIISLKDFERHEFERVFEVAEKLAPIAHNRKNVDLL